MDCTSGRTFSAKSRRLFSAFSRGIPPYIMWITTFSMLMVCCIVLIFSMMQQTFSREPGGVDKGEIVPAGAAAGP